MSDLSLTKKNARADLIAAFASGATVEEAAVRIGVSSRTIYRWCVSDPEFAESVAEAKSRADDQVEFITYQNCLDVDSAHNTLRMFWLKSRRPEVYRETTKQVIEDARKEYDVNNPPEAI